jgi:hypothetical protein
MIVGGWVRVGYGRVLLVHSDLQACGPGPGLFAQLPGHLLNYGQYTS